MVQELENKQQHLAGKMKALTLEIHHIKSEGEGRALQQAQEELQDTKEEKERATLDLEKAKKVSCFLNFNSLCMLGNFSCFCCLLLTFFKTNFFKKFFQGLYQSIKQFGSRSGPTECRS